MKNAVLVTGSAKNLGAGIIEEFAKNGYNVVINYNNSHEKAKKLCEKIQNNYNVEAMVIQCDITREDSVIKMKEEIIKRFKRIDVLVNNAAVEITSEIDDKDYDSFRKVLDVNVIGTFLVTKHIGKYMFENTGGKIVNISSNNGIDKYSPSTMEYDASKAAIINMTYNFAKEFAPLVRVNAVAPGWIKTDSIKELDDSLDNKFIESEKNNVLLNRFAEVDEIAKVVYFLSTDDSSYINGTVIKVDGGCK